MSGKDDDGPFVTLLPSASRNFMPVPSSTKSWARRWKEQHDLYNVDRKDFQRTTSGSILPQRNAKETTVRLVQRRNGVWSGDHKRNGLKHGVAIAPKSKRSTKRFSILGTFGGHRLPGHAGHQRWRFGVVSVGDVIDKKPKITKTDPGPPLKFDRQAN